MKNLKILGLAAVLVVACDRTKLVSVRPPDMRVDLVSQRSASKVDVLWVVDNSGSMAPRQENLARNFQSFIDLFSKGAIDFRIAVTTTDIFKDLGQFKGSPKFLTPSTPNLATAFANRVKVGTSGSAYEAGLQAAQMALDRQKLANEPEMKDLADCQDTCMKTSNFTECRESCINQHPVDFLRPDAYLYLIFVSDEDDKSAQDIRYYWRMYEMAKGMGNDETVMTAAIIGDVPSNTCKATPGARYVSLSKLTGGDVGSICDENFSATLKKLATNAVGLRRKFALSKAPNVDTLKVSILYRCDADPSFFTSCVSVDKTECEGQPPEAQNAVCVPVKDGPNGWSYEPETEVIDFAGDSLPGLRSTVQIEYYEEGTGPE